MSKSVLKAILLLSILAIAAMAVLSFIGFFKAPAQDATISPAQADPSELASLLPSLTGAQLDSQIVNASSDIGQFARQMDDEIASDTTATLLG